MIIYSGSKRDFQKDVMNGVIANRIDSLFRQGSFRKKDVADALTAFTSGDVEAGHIMCSRELHSSALDVYGVPVLAAVGLLGLVEHPAPADLLAVKADLLLTACASLRQDIILYSYSELLPCHA